MIAFTQMLKTNTNEFIYTKQKQTHRNRNKFLVTKGERRKGWQIRNVD